MNTTILTVQVGSVAHGLATEKSDTDYRGCFVTPTSEILALGGTMKHTSWLDDDVDNTSWEVGHFLFMSTKCNPTVLETFLAPVKYADAWGMELRYLFPYVWNSTGVRNAFIGYGLNQRKKMLDRRDAQTVKYAVAYLRTLYCAYQLLSIGTFPVNVAGTEIESTLRQWKSGQYEIGEIIDKCLFWEDNINVVYETGSRHETDLRPVNEYLLRLRRAMW